VTADASRREPSASRDEPRRLRSGPRARAAARGRTPHARC